MARTAEFSLGRPEVYGVEDVERLGAEQDVRALSHDWRLKFTAHPERGEDECGAGEGVATNVAVSAVGRVGEGVDVEILLQLICAVARTAEKRFLAHNEDRALIRLVGQRCIGVDRYVDGVSRACLVNAGEDPAVYNIAQSGISVVELGKVPGPAHVQDVCGVGVRDAPLCIDLEYIRNDVAG